MPHGAGGVSVWRVALDDFEPLTNSRLRWLSEAERRRAHNFHTRELADRWRIAHVALRDVLAAATGQRPDAVHFTRDAKGKPHLARTDSPSFNLSHSGDVALVAVASDAPLGVDVELVQPVPEMEGVAASHFATEERDALWTMPEGERLMAFYRCWTRKEAYVKATGSGLGADLARFAVSIGTDDARLIRVDDDADAPHAWSLRDLALEPPYVGALAVRGRALSVTLREWTPHHQ